jgi:hypothetical protein
MGEVYNAEQAEDDGEADGDKDVEAAQDKPADDLRQ